MPNEPLADLPAPLRWECPDKQRYYVAMAQTNLFGEMEVWRAWGSIGSRRGGQQVDCVAGHDAARKLLSHIGKRRTARGYVKVSLGQRDESLR